MTTTIRLFKGRIYGRKASIKRDAQKAGISDRRQRRFEKARKLRDNRAAIQNSSLSEEKKKEALASLARKKSLKERVFRR